jgi:hypothetical protein
VEIGLPEASQAADRRLTEWIDPARPFSSAKVGDWQARIEDAVRRELDAALARELLRLTTARSRSPALSRNRVTRPQAGNPVPEQRSPSPGRDSRPGIAGPVPE